MIALSLSEIASAIGGRLIGPDAKFCGVSTDTRTLKHNELFVALKGQHFDGHDSLAEAQRKGAAAVVIEHSAGTLSAVRVDDTRRALGKLANLWRRRFSIPVIGITGSNGKTSTKEMASAILRQRYRVLATIGNLNNEIGVPQTLFGLAVENEVAVIEMGASQPDDIGDLAQIAEPTVGVVTMCGPAHLAGFGDLKGVAAAKGQLFTALRDTGTAIINADDQFSPVWRALSKHANQCTFGIRSAAEFMARDIVELGLGRGTEFFLVAPTGSIDVHLPVDGLHNIYNALAAAAATAAVGATLADTQKGLAAVRPVHGRLVPTGGINGSLLIDDTYNANPVSLVAALDVLRNAPGQHWLVLGDMGELGVTEIEQHRFAGESAKTRGIERLFLIGELAAEAAVGFGGGAEHFDDSQGLIAKLRTELHCGITLLIKGSRKMQLDRVVAALSLTNVSLC
ncbi:MAG: UDP-N-acetylmuramoyl-tripeptide--D-alanyl-D-alanine ligase [Gammaproteobacteria bacterium]|nr:UDP-N-acetylmuramoyl-tripeptide--D-alanyl-D-alanine ligase [Gammaproteobacteria bacterium]